MSETISKMAKPVVGDIWVSVYEYYDTTYDFYRVVSVSGRKITFMKLQKVGYGNYNGGAYHVKPTNDLTGTTLSKNWTGRAMRHGYRRMLRFISVDKSYQSPTVSP